MRAHIKSNIKKLRITYLVTGPYSDLYIGKLRGDASATGSFDVSAKKAVLLGSGKDPVSFTTMKDVGRLLAAALHTPSATSPRVLKVNSFTATPDEILELFEKETGSKWEVSYTSLDLLRRLEKEAWESGSPLATVYTLRRIWTEGGTLYDERDNGKIGAPATESLEEQVRKAVKVEAEGFQSGAL